MERVYKNNLFGPGGALGAMSLGIKKNDTVLIKNSVAFKLEEGTGTAPNADCTNEGVIIYNDNYFLGCKDTGGGTLKWKQLDN